ncbi:hypothetical protein ACQPZ2_00765 [Nocardia pseudovaccinii]|uniref:hypothetical protein n=1 Tax=Nocardia pseudovaccinii TaxID=189540 RepID=UPI003D8D871D
MEAVPPDRNDPDSYLVGQRGSYAKDRAEWAREVVKHAGKHGKTPSETTVSPCSLCQVCTASPPPAPVEQALEVLDQAAAERELFELLRSEEVQGPVWDWVATALIEYATQVLHPWICTGEIYRRLAEKRIGLKADADERRVLVVDRDRRIEIIDRTVVDALTKFQGHMRAEKGWDPCRGAMLRTFFLTACLFEFRRVLEEDLRWRRTNQPVSHGVNGIEELVDTRSCSGSRSGADPMSVVTERMAILEFLATLSPTDRIIVLKVAHGYTQREIADLFPNANLTTKVIEHRLRKIREHARLNLRTHE